MIDGIIKWSLHNRLIIVLAGAALLLWGSYETLRMPVDVFPDLTAPTVTVMTGSFVPTWTLAFSLFLTLILGLAKTSESVFVLAKSNSAVGKV